MNWLNNFVILVQLANLMGITKAQQSTACAGVINGRFVRNSESCSSYYYCYNEIAQAAKCPTNYLFNPLNQICDLPHLVDCIRCSPTGIQNIEDPTDCRKYYHCVAGVRTHKTCSDGLAFDPTIGDCNFESNVPCKVDNSICSQFSAIPYLQFGDPNDCTKYFVCLNGVTYRQSCVQGLYFNAHVSSCDLPGDFNFCQDFGPIITPAPDENNTPDPIWNLITGSPTTTARPTAATTTTARTTAAAATTTTVRTTAAATTTTARATTAATTTAGLPWAQTTATPAPTVDGDKLPTWSGEYLCYEPNGNFSVPGSCTSYVRCVNGEQLYPVITCGPGLLFWDKYQSCGYFGIEGCFKEEFVNDVCKKDNGYFPVPGWCGKYVYCSNGKIEETFVCDEGTYWTQSIEECTLVKPYYC